MVETIEPKDNGLTEAQNNSTLEQSTTERPSWLPEKFESAEAMAKSYGQLEKEYSNLKNTQTPQEQVAEVNKATGLSLDGYFDEFSQNNSLSDKSYDDLAKQGLSKDIVDKYIAGQQALADNQLNQVYQAAGDKSGYEEMVKWAGENLSAAEVETFNKQVEQGTMEEAIMATSGLKARYDNAVGVTPNLVQGEVSTTTNAFQSTAEIISAVNDPRYQVDTAYRQSVEEKIKRSNALG
tara:strand:+ start:506 stop:1216 length:711 start_codon:yes stop_codon:yes gene_type:complete